MTLRTHYLAIALLAGFGLALGACGGGGGDGAPMTETPEVPETPDLGPAQMAAAAAAMAAATAADAAEAAVMAQDANMAADAASYAVAQNAAERARAAATAASAANTAAQAATTLAVAEAQRNIALVKQAEAEAEQANAMKYAGMVADAQQAIEDENQRVMDVATARSNAMQSYVDASNDATKAEAAATEARETAPGSPGAMAASEAALAARMAANRAKMAHDAITDGMTKAEADAQAIAAAMAASSANAAYMLAKAENDTIQTNLATVDEQNRARDVAAATTAAGEAAMAAREAATAARAAATKASDRAIAGRNAVHRARAARTDHVTAKMHNDMAKAAYEAAKAAAEAAEMAADAAEAAHRGIDPAGSAADAQAAQMTAETGQETAETAQDTAETQYMAVMEAVDDALMYVDMHVLRLFMAANGYHVMDDEATDANETAAHVTSVGAAMAAIANATDGNQTAGTTASAVWPADTPDDLTTPDTDESAMGMLSVTVSPAGAGDMPFELGATRAADPTATPPVTARIQTAERIPGLGVFMHGFDIWEDLGAADDTNADRARVIVFTNKEQATPLVPAVTAVTAKTLTNAALTGNTVTDLGTRSGSGYTGVTFFEGTTTTDEGVAFTGTLTCPSGTACSAERVVGADDAVTYTVEGYVFSGSREARAAVAEVAADPKNDYLVFGLWLDESTDGGTDTFGSFAVGGTGYTVNAQNTVTGTADYIGKAAGAHHKTGMGVNWFNGDARLTANFGAADAPGTISGSISNIRVAGGDPMSDSIYLGQAALTDATATFNGAAFIGAATAPGASTHEFDGTWSGSFFGATADDDTTADVNEAETTAPLAAAGTFGVTKSMTTGTGADAMTIVESFVGAFGAEKQ